MRPDQRAPAGARNARGGLGLTWMNARTRNAALAFAGLLAFALASWAIFRGYLTPEMMVYFLTFQWCL